MFAWLPTLSRRDISSDIKRQLGARGADFDFFSLACDESTEASDTVHLLFSKPLALSQTCPMYCSPELSVTLHISAGK